MSTIMFSIHFFPCITALSRSSTDISWRRMKYNLFLEYFQNILTMQRLHTSQGTSSQFRCITANEKTTFHLTRLPLKSVQMDQVQSVFSKMAIWIVLTKNNSQQDALILKCAYLTTAGVIVGTVIRKFICECHVFRSSSPLKPAT